MTEIEDETMIVGISGMQEVIRAIRGGIEDVVEGEGDIVIEMVDFCTNRIIILYPVVKTLTGDFF